MAPGYQECLAFSVLSTICHSTYCLFYGPRISKSASSVLSPFYLLFILWFQDTKECLVPAVNHQGRGEQGRGEQGRRERGRGVHSCDQLPHLTHRGGAAHRSSPRARRWVKISYLCTYELYSPMHNVWRAYPLQGQVGGGRALEIERFLGPVKWHRASRRVPFGAQKAHKS